MLVLNKAFPPYGNPTNRVEESCRLCGSGHTVGHTTPQRVRYQSGWEYTYDVCSACTTLYRRQNAQTGIETLKRSYNHLVGRIGAATEILDGKKYPDAEEARYQRAFEILGTQIANVLRQLQDQGVKPSKTEIENGFEIEQGVAENAE